MLDALPLPDYDPEEVLTKVGFDSDNKCWNWNGYVTRYGYGTYGHRNHMVHRVVYEILVAKLGTEDSIDHLCLNRRCVNPKHLEVVTLRENVLRSNNVASLNARKTSCLKGHEFSKSNTYIHPKRGTRNCITCQVERTKAHSQRIRK